MDKRILLILIPIVLLGALYYNALYPSKTQLTATVCSNGPSQIQLYECENYDSGCINPKTIVSVFYDKGGGILKYRLTPGFYALYFNNSDLRGISREDHRDFIVTRRSPERIEKFDCGSFD